jgi:hypothetical protein
MSAVMDRANRARLVHAVAVRLAARPITDSTVRRAIANAVATLARLDQADAA